MGSKKKIATARPPKGLAPNVRTKNLTNWEQVCWQPRSSRVIIQEEHGTKQKVSGCPPQCISLGLAPNGRQKNLTNWEKVMTNPWTNRTSLEPNHSKLRHLRRGREIQSLDKKNRPISTALCSQFRKAKTRSSIGPRCLKPLSTTHMYLER